MGGPSFYNMLLTILLGFGLERCEALRERVVSRVVGPWALDPAAVYELPSGRVAALGAQIGQALSLARIAAFVADRVVANTAVRATKIAKIHITNNACFNNLAPRAIIFSTCVTPPYSGANSVNRAELVCFLRAAGIQAAVVASPKVIFAVQAERLGAEVAVAALADGAVRPYSAYEVGYGRASDFVSVLAPVLLLANP